MQITLDARLVLPYMTGIGRYLLGVISGMKSVQMDDFVEIWLQQGLPADHPLWDLTSDHMHMKQIPLRHMDLRAQWVIPRMLKQNPTDLFHYPHFDLPCFAPGNCVITIHDLKYLQQPNYFRRWTHAKHILMKTMMSHTVKKAKKILTVSQFTSQEIQNRFHLDASKIHITPHGVDEKFFLACPPGLLQHVHEKYQLPANYILAVGERRPHKNITGLIKAFSIFQKRTRLPVALVIVGKAYANYREPEKLVENLGLSSQVHFLEFVDEKDLPAIYQDASLFAMLSFHEGFGLPVLEAMASGVPVIASNLAALPEVLGDCGILVNPLDSELVADAIVKILADPVIKEAFITCGRQRARKFTWENCAQQTLQVYHNVGKA